MSSWVNSFCKGMALRYFLCSLIHTKYDKRCICMSMCVNIIIAATGYKKYLISRSFNEYARKVRWLCCLFMNIHELYEQIEHVLVLMQINMQNFCQANLYINEPFFTSIHRLYRVKSSYRYAIYTNST